MKRLISWIWNIFLGAVICLAIAATLSSLFKIGGPCYAPESGSSHAYFAVAHPKLALRSGDFALLDCARFKLMVSVEEVVTPPEGASFPILSFSCSGAEHSVPPSNQLAGRVIFHVPATIFRFFHGIPLILFVLALLCVNEVVSRYFAPPKPTKPMRLRKDSPLGAWHTLDREERAVVRHFFQHHEGLVACSHCRVRMEDPQDHDPEANGTCDEFGKLIVTSEITLSAGEDGAALCQCGERLPAQLVKPKEAAQPPASGVDPTDTDTDASTAGADAVQIHDTPASKGGKGKGKKAASQALSAAEIRKRIQSGQKQRNKRAAGPSSPSTSSAVVPRKPGEYLFRNGPLSDSQKILYFGLVLGACFLAVKVGL
eukprot:gnl/Trimastix_PCT/2595.p1 GENE.gnl/Trimastix_PCT/2595~~gnl/Trimastix_PCT/2595.p1  ORF type:complete len:371 (+),score=70.83 gnl/Trimastix_PCT/2595:116-1228(+)